MKLDVADEASVDAAVASTVAHGKRKVADERSVVAAPAKTAKLNAAFDPLAGLGDEDEDSDEDDGSEIIDLLANTLATPEGETLCGTLVKISNTLETQNKILIKLLTALSKKN